MVSFLEVKIGGHVEGSQQRHTASKDIDHRDGIVIKEATVRGQFEQS